MRIRHATSGGPRPSTGREALHRHRGAQRPGAGPLVALLLAAVGWAAVGRAPAAAQVPTPESVIGWEPGADRRLADYDQILEYFRALDGASDRLELAEIGRTAEGRPMILALISSAENLKQAGRYREISRRLAEAEVADEEEARSLAREGKAVVWIDGGLHATEVAGAQSTPRLAYRLVTEESEEARRIRERVIVLLMPVMNPDGLDLVAGWYRSHVGTEFETAPLPRLYQKYVGHDNNRDFFMILQPETRAVAHQLWGVWFPQIVLNHHQTGPFPARIFIPPFADPLNPRIPPLVVTGINLVGAAIHRRFAEERKPGAVSRISYTQWWNGGMRTAPYFHNQVGILTEVALHRYATPRRYPPDSLPHRFSNGVAADRPSTWYPDPWRGGWWRLADAVEYMITASMAVADIAAERRENWLLNAYRMAERAIERGEREAPFAYVVDPGAQGDAGEAMVLLRVLDRGGIRIRRAVAPFRAGEREHPAGSFVLYAGQPYRPHLLDLLEPQDYPDRRLYPGGPPDPPYDLAGWTLPLQMGVRVDRVEEPFEARTERVSGSRLRLEGGGITGSGPLLLLGPEQNAAFRLVNRVLGEEPGAGDAGVQVERATTAFRAGKRDWPAGTFLLRGDRARLGPLAREEGLELTAAAPEAVESAPVRRPRVGLYRSWVANMDEGWTRWILERYGFAYETLSDTDVRAGELGRFDVIVLPSQSPESLLHGHRPGTMPPEYTGGVGLEGALRLQRFVERGGLLVTLDEASDFAIQAFGLPLRDAVADLPRREFFIPGSLIRLRVDSSDPVAYGMPEEGAAFFVRSRAFRILPEASGAVDASGVPEVSGAPGASDAPRRPTVPRVDVVARYADDDLLLSGWELGAQRHLAGKPAVVRVPLGRGSVVMIGFRSQFRAQPRGTFKLLFNALYAGSSGDTPGRSVNP